MHETPVVRMSGPGLARGEQYGEQVSALVCEAAQRWRDRIGTNLRIPIADYVDVLVDGSGFATAAKLHDPDLIDEITGVARPAGVDARTLFAMNLLDEEWTVRPEYATSGQGHHCSSLAVRSQPGQPPLLAQNMDLPAWLDGLQVLLEIDAPSAPRALVPSVAGMVALNAFNDVGLGVCVNTLAQLPASREGVPVAFLVRTVARQATVASAVAELGRARHTAGQNYLIAGPDCVADLECSARGVVEWGAAEPRLVHTNHPLAEGDPATEATVGAGSQSNTERR